uniref:GABA type A receptor associated protein like 2 n=1 Tax=Equus asinus TaxID=9793 RepID=A0A8C4M956_EQUAS
MPTSPTSPPPLPGRPLAATPCVRPRPLAQRRGKWSRKPRPGRLLGSGGRKSRLSCSRRRRRRCRCCCSWCSELRGSESRLRPFPAAAMKWMFKEDHSLEHRCVESAKIRAKYPDRVPVIVEKVSGSQIVDIDKRKYLVPSDITVAQFMWIIRKRIQLPSEKAIFLFVDKTVPQSRSKELGCMICPRQHG